MQMAQVSSSPFTSSGEWDGCNYLSLKIIRVCLLEPERRSGAHGTAEEWIKKKKEKKKDLLERRNMAWWGKGEWTGGWSPVSPHLCYPVKALTPQKVTSYLSDLLLAFPGFILSWDISVCFDSPKLALVPASYVNQSPVLSYSADKEAVRRL